MSTAAVSSSTSLHSAGQVSARGHIGLVVLGAIASGLLSGLLLVLVVLAGGPEHQIIGAALVALGIGFVVLAVGSSRFTDQPQPWALLPGVASAVVGVAIWALAPSDRTLTLAGWVWPELLLVLVVWSFRGARQALHNWSRRALFYPSLLVLLLIAAGGAHPWPLRARGAFRRRCLRPRLRRAVSGRGCRCRADRLGNAISVRSSGLPGLLQHGAAPLLSDAHVRARWHRQVERR